MKSLILFVFLVLGAFAEDPTPAPVVIIAGEVTVEEAAPPSDAVEDVKLAEPVAEPAVDTPPPGPPTTDEEALRAVAAILDAFKAGQIPFAVGMALTLLVYVANRIGLQEVLPQQAVPVLAFGVGVLGAVGTGLVMGVPWAAAIVSGITAGIAAVGGWEALSKVFTSMKTE